ncbi:MAG TPA: glutathionylspermidine synthase family protein [Gemmatimonadaceae bacterium]|nr:glutathionylspermidine synthase family protein [Gemmatimonadaceae bacterium]
MSLPWLPVSRVPAPAFAAIRRRAIFDCCKWDPQVEDECTVADFALVLPPTAWRELAGMAERLAAETLAAEAEMTARPDLHSRLGLPRLVRRALARPLAPGEVAAATGFARITRFDFHLTPEGWRISEANTDVPGGLNEASGYASLLAPYYPGAASVGDPTRAYAEAIARSLGSGATVVLAHATAYTDDRQVMAYLGRELERLGLRVQLASPAHLRWHRGRARLATAWAHGQVDGIVRFFPGEWLPNLPRRCGWRHFFRRRATPLSNPATALLTQSKRWPLVWNELDTPVPTWRSLLPDTHDPRACDWRASEDWVIKPALGRVGEDVGIPGLTQQKEWGKLARAARWHPARWVAQRRFESVPLMVDGDAVHPCVGVYTVDGRAAGAYGRLARQPLINWKARDVAVLQVSSVEEPREDFEPGILAEVGVPTLSEHPRHPPPATRNAQ